jgi:hypothetical protein
MNNEGKKMSFKSWRSYWTFSHAVKNKSRYILDDESKEFLKAVEDTCTSRIKIIPISDSLWRSQLGCEYMPVYQEDIHVDSVPIPFAFERMKPLSHSASEGRANPKGIPYLYVATDKETAMSEVRPSLGAILSIGEFKPTSELKVIDLSVHQGRMKFFLKEPDEQQKIEAVWTDMDNAFSIPTSNTNFNSEYIPTQIIAELIKSLGYDGIQYKSSLGDGHNIALFNLDMAIISECDIYKANKVSFGFESIVTQDTQGT